MAGSSRLTDLAARVTEAVAHSVLRHSGGIVGAVSGGADSAVLAWALVEAGAGVTLVHVHHGWEASDVMARAAAEIAASLDLPLHIERVDTTAPGSAEAVARAARYEALAEVAGDRMVATGHTSTDQAETVVGHLMWGSGLDGLRGIHRRTERLVRPLLDLSRAEIRELAALLDLPFRDDPANQQTRFRRVRIRRALAEWERRLAPGMSKRLTAMAGLVAEDLASLEPEFSTLRLSAGSVAIPAGVLRTVARPQAARLVRHALRSLTGHPGSLADIETVLDVAASGGAGEVGGGHRVERHGALVRIGADPSDPPRAELWDLEGERRWGGWSWTAAWHSGRPDVFPLSPWTQVFDEEVAAAGSAVLRSVEPGDRLAMRSGSKDARQALAEAHIPPSDRDGWPLLEIGGRAMWLPGVRRADAGWVSDHTRRYLVVTAQREGTWKPGES